MRISSGLLALVMLLASSVATAGPSTAPATRPATDEVLARIGAESIHADVRHLADDRFMGRYCRSPEAFEAARWIASRFEKAGLEPIDGAADFFRGVGDERIAPNVVGIRRGSGDGYVLIGAHYDHLRPLNRPDGDRIFNGADDNASGVAGVIAIAEATRDVGTEATLVFIAFTAEEIGLRGARHLAGDPPFELAQVRGLFNMDMISRGRDDLIFVDGGREAGPLRDALRRANERHAIGLEIRFDQYPSWLQRSDQGPFISRKVPAVLLSVEDHEDYHRVSDHADRILPKLAERVTRLVAAAAIDLAGNGEGGNHR
jgi:hypothetical protein